MSKSRNYTEQQVVEALNKKMDLRVRNGQIQELKTHPIGKGSTPAKGDVGIKSRGKIDFLTRYLDYTHFYVDKFEN